MPFRIIKSALVGGTYVRGLDKLRPKKYLAIDTETTGLDPWGPKYTNPNKTAARPFIVTLCDENGNTALFRWTVNAMTRQVIYDKKIIVTLHRLLSAPWLIKIFFNRTFDIKMLRAMGMTIAGIQHDAMVRQHAIRSDELSFGLKHLCKKYLKIDDDDEEALQKSTIVGRRLGKKLGYKLGDDVKEDYWLADPAICEEYALRDAVRHMTLFLAQEEYRQNEKAS